MQYFKSASVTLSAIIYSICESKVQSDDNRFTRKYAISRGEKFLQKTRQTKVVTDEKSDMSGGVK